MKIKELIQTLEKLNETQQLADMDVQFLSLYDTIFKIEDIIVDKEDNVVVFQLDEGFVDD